MSLEDLAFPPTAQERLSAAQALRRVVSELDVLRNDQVFAVDPGTTQSGWCLFDGKSVLDSGVADNHDILNWIKSSTAAHLAIEMISSYGMPVGRETFETVRWIGRFQQAWSAPESVRLIFRKDVKNVLCNSARAKDANIRQALLDRFPATGGGKTPQVGIKSQPGPLYGVSSHAWSALAVAVVHKITEGEAK